MRHTPIIKLGIAVIVLVAAGGVIGYALSKQSVSEKLIACIEEKGWHRVTQPFIIPGLEHLDLATDWFGGPGAYADVHSRRPSSHFAFVAVSGRPGEADEGRLYKEVQVDPSKFEAVLVSYHAPNPGGEGSDVVSSCSFKVEPNEGP
jgi:hypothetical protein